ncbi:MAG: ABC transporter substrate-binding protein [Acetobacteraceae bacterium]|nr:ABC transporter substrate-binding protein [Acetobacteraceae bacterium]
MKITRRTLLGATALSLVHASTGSAAPSDIVFTSWGGTTQDAQKKAWADPFQKETGIRVKMDGPTDYGKFKAMVDSGNVSWDVVDTEGDFAVAAAKQGLLEKIDYTIVDRTHLDPRFTSDYYVGSFYYSFVIGFNKTALGKEPKNWADVFDLKNFSGKRTFYKWSAPGVLEIALLADGMAPDKLYPLDLDRAFRKLDTIKSEIVWWSGGAQSQQLLASGEAALGQFWNGRVFAVQKEQEGIGMSWEQNLTAADLLVVPKGTKNKEAAMKFLAAATSAKGQADMATQTNYAPVNTESAKLMSASDRAGLPDQHTQGQINLDMNYWAEHREEIGKRWYEWQAK